MKNDNQKTPEPEVIFEGGKDNKPPKTGVSKLRREVGERHELVISEELFYSVKEKIENRNKLK